MILEISLALLSPSLWGISVDHRSLEPIPGQLSAESFMVKFLGIMIQFTVYTVNEEDE